MAELIAVVGGGVVALALRSTTKLIANWVSSRHPIAEYPCAENGTDDDPAAVRHAWGSEVADADATEGRAWAYSFDRPYGRGREHVVYGPYTNDFGRPGHFRVSFRIAGYGFGPHDRDPMVILDVLQAPFDQQRNHLVLGQLRLRGSDLTPQYKTFSIACYSTGVGVYEYRARVVDRRFSPERHRIHFDIIRVFPRFPLFDVL